MYYGDVQVDVAYVIYYGAVVAVSCRVILLNKTVKYTTYYGESEFQAVQYTVVGSGKYYPRCTGAKYGVDGDPRVIVRSVCKLCADKNRRAV